MVELFKKYIDKDLFPFLFLIGGVMAATGALQTWVLFTLLLK